MKTTALHILHVGVLVFAIAFSSYGQTCVIKGSVTAEGGSVNQIKVTVNDSIVFTDQHGNFSLVLPEGICRILVTETGYEVYRSELHLKISDTILVQIHLIRIKELGEVVVLGSRTLKQRSNLLSLVPVDVLSSKYLTQTGQTNLTQMLNYSAPAINSSRPLINEPITLRGLDPDQLLILINGTRYHNMAYLNDGRLRGALGRGSVSNDINSIPFSAIERIEILRDGASAQYGSDAIAGVINIHLKKTTDRTHIWFQTGQYYKGDGEAYSAGLNTGIPLQKKGFINFSADMRYRNYTDRGGEYTGTVYVTNRIQDDSIVKARNFDRNKVSNAGTGKQNSIGFLLNGAYKLTDKVEMFWTGIFNSRTNVVVSAFRFPKNARQVNPTLYPDGFRPLAKQNTIDHSFKLGAKGNNSKNINWEFCSSYGTNRGRYYAEKTNNASQFYSLGNNAPTAFHTGALLFSQFSNDLNFVKSKKTRQLLNIAFGIGWRLEQYNITAGEMAAWYNYDSLERKQGGSQNGLIFRPENVINKSRNVSAAYIDVETDLSKKVLMGTAMRYEYYSDYGGNLAGKIALRYKVMEKFHLRCSVSNGFRAPALQQRHFSNTVRTSLQTSAGLVPVTSGIFSNTSAIASAFGIHSLKAERSVNTSTGFTATITRRINLTADAYLIHVKNRIVLSGRFDKAANLNVQQILSGYPEIDQVQFFANAINTHTRGIDVILNTLFQHKKNTLTIMLAANCNKTKVGNDIKTTDKLPADSLNTNTLFNREEKMRIEGSQPRSKISLSLNYKMPQAGFNLRNTMFGKTSLVFDSRDRTRDESFSPKILSDLSLYYTIKNWLTITAGANNIFNIYPQKVVNPLNTAEGTFIYSQEGSPFGFNGGEYFINIAVIL